MTTEFSLDRFFETAEAVTPDLLEATYALRYQVYCLENSFEDPGQFLNCRESDCYDSFSKHIALIHRSTLEVAGTVRLVIPHPQATPALPLLGVLEDTDRAEILRYPFDHMAEISRYAISKSFRRRKDEGELADVGYIDAPVPGSQRGMPHLTLGLMRGVLQLGRSQHIQYFCGCMKPSLLRLLSQFGLLFTPIGPLVNHHGRRQPCIASMEDLLNGLKKHSEEFYHVVLGPLA